MILKSLSRSRPDYANLLNYIFNDHDTVRGKEAFVLKKNLSGNSIEQWVKQYKFNEANRIHQRKNNVKIFHEVISFSRHDTPNITPAKIKAIGKKYLQLRGENIMTIGTVHHNRDHIHLHFCVSPVEIETGRSIRVSRDTFRKLKNELQQFHLEKFPEIKNSTVDHNKKKMERTSEKEYQMKKRGMVSEREKVKNILDMIYLKSTSVNEFIQGVQSNGLQIYYRSGKVYGIRGARKMRFSSLGINLYELEKKYEMMVEFLKLRDHPNHRNLGRDK